MAQFNFDASNFAAPTSSTGFSTTVIGPVLMHTCMIYDQSNTYQEVDFTWTPESAPTAVSNGYTISFNIGRQIYSTGLQWLLDITTRDPHTGDTHDLTITYQSNSVVPDFYDRLRVIDGADTIWSQQGDNFWPNESSNKDIVFVYLPGFVNMSVGGVDYFADIPATVLPAGSIITKLFFHCDGTAGAGPTPGPTAGTWCNFTIVGQEYIPVPTTYTLSPIANGVQFFDNQGKPLAGGNLFTYVQDSSSEQATTWADGNGDTENSNPLVLDSSGRLVTDIWLDAAQGYNFVLTKSDGLTVLTDVNGVTGITSQHYINEIISGLDEVYLRLSGGTVTGGLTVGGSTNLHGTIISGNLQVTGTSQLAGIDNDNELITSVLTPVSNTDAANKEYVDAAVAGVSAATPSGVTAWFAASTPPAGWFECNGQAVSRTTYSSLFTAISTTFGVGDGSTTFNVPDMRGYFARGWDNGRGTDPGRTFGTNQGDALQNIIGYFGCDDRIQDNHAAVGAFQSNAGTPAQAFAAGAPNVDTTAEGGDGRACYVKFDASLSVGARTAAETRGINIALLPIIKQ